MGLKIAIIIPTYNSKRFLGECLWSALQQDYKHELEIIVVDNESEDGTLDVIDTVVNDYKRDCEFYRLSGGPCTERKIVVDSAPNLYKYTWDEATRKGLELMSDDVDYFTFLASDDKIDHSYIANNARVLSKADGKIKAMQSFVQSFGSRNDVLGWQYKDIDEFKKLCLKQCPVNTPSIMWHSDLYRSGQMESKPEIYAGAADYWLYCNLANEGIFIYPYPQTLGYNYRWSEEQATWGMHRDFKGIDKKIQEYWEQRWVQNGLK